MSAPPVPTSISVVGSAVPSSSRLTPQRLNATPPDNRLTRRRSRRLPTSVGWSSSGPSRCSSAPSRRSIGQVSRWRVDRPGLVPAGCWRTLARRMPSLARRPARRPARRLLPMVGAVLLLLTVAGQVAALSTYYPIQSVGNRGSDVRALQYLLRGAGRSVTVDGLFGASTRAAVVAHQQARGFPATGVVNDPTWRSPHAEPVDGQQRRCRPRAAAAAQRQAQSRADRQRHLRNGDARRSHGLPAPHDIHVVRVGRRHHLAPAALAFRAARCGAARAGCATTASATGRRTGGPARRSASSRRRPRGASTTPATAAWRSATSGCEHGGDIPGHETHERGLDVDIRPIRDAENQCTLGDELAARRRTTGQRRAR